MAFRDNRIVFAFLGISTLIVFLQTKGLGLKLSLSEVLKTSSPNIDLPRLDSAVEVYLCSMICSLD